MQDLKMLICLCRKNEKKVTLKRRQIGIERSNRLCSRTVRREMNGNNEREVSLQ